MHYFSLAGILHCTNGNFDRSQVILTANAWAGKGQKSWPSQSYLYRTVRMTCKWSTPCNEEWLRNFTQPARFDLTFLLSSVGSRKIKRLLICWATPCLNFPRIEVGQEISYDLHTTHILWRPHTASGIGKVPSHLDHLKNEGPRRGMKQKSTAGKLFDSVSALSRGS